MLAFIEILFKIDSQMNVLEEKKVSQLTFLKKDKFCNLFGAALLHKKILKVEDSCSFGENIYLVVLLNQFFVRNILYTSFIRKTGFNSFLKVY